ncbi:unnamed protein product [Rotaria socialis]|uniref:Uncharacterized protein n=1 Tax=Rotaria socialis TaxID=392032 RepID=A0A820JEG9_9BILA|nr:unnamed protein product [Rotaria socialis]CAF3338753.1 unnamed protein product [Rotaria socialis]CAF3403729.1 unnamed protein product [Rotaria socialis]CAF3477929.1 unnamed protein product [Rotaria socialis]CAF3753286.1 unnamed protein product [Rotaria socialis]
MKIYSYIVGLLLACITVLIHARNLHYGFNDQLDNDDYNLNTQDRQMFRSDYNLRRLPSIDTNLLNFFANEENNRRERAIATARRAQAIVKGDPREFMG